MYNDQSTQVAAGQADLGLAVTRQSAFEQSASEQPVTGQSTPYAERQQFIVIGLDDNPTQYFPPEVTRLIEEGSIFSGGLRHRKIVSSLLPPQAVWIDITVPLDNVFTRYEAYPQIIVFASGDPLFFGFANTIRKRLPDANIRLYPAFNSLQTLAHRLVMPYDDMRTVSLTGRPWQEFDRALIEHAPKIGILTDREHTPATIARRMLDYGYNYYTMYVGEHLGNQDKERIRRFTPEEAACCDFEHPNNLILQSIAPDSGQQSNSTYRNGTLDSGQPINPVYRNVIPDYDRRFFGIPDDRFALLDGRVKMITKAPIRLLTLSALSLQTRRSFWDVGFCTGSVSIEARLQFPHLHVTAFEIRPEGRELMETNSRRFGAPGITAVIGDFLTVDLSAYPRPDAVFIGGHGGHLKEIISRIRSVLLPGGILVFNSVSAESRTLFEEGVKGEIRKEESKKEEGVLEKGKKEEERQEKSGKEKSVRKEKVKEAHLELLPGIRIAIDDFNPIEILKAIDTDA